MINEDLYKNSDSVGTRFASGQKARARIQSRSSATQNCMRTLYAHTSIFSEDLNSQIRTIQILFQISLMLLIKIAVALFHKTNASQRI